MARLDRHITLTVRDEPHRTAGGQTPGAVLFTGSIWAELIESVAELDTSRSGGIFTLQDVSRRRWRVRWRADLVGIGNPSDRITVADDLGENAVRRVIEDPDAPRRRFHILEVMN